MTEQQQQRLDELIAAPHALGKRERRELSKLIRLWRETDTEVDDPFNGDSEL